MRRKSCTCDYCGGNINNYEVKISDIEFEPIMIRKIRLQKLLIDNLNGGSLSSFQRRERQLSVLKKGRWYKICPNILIVLFLFVESLGKNFLRGRKKREEKLNSCLRWLRS